MASTDASGKTREDYFLGGRQLGPVVAAISYSASATSAWTLLGVSGIAYVAGFSTLWLVAGVVLGCVVAWWWVAPRMMAYSRQHNIVTLTEFLAHRSSGAARQRIVLFATLIVLVSFVFYISSQFQGAGNSFSSTFGLDSDSSILIGGGIIMLYTLLGGFWAVSLTDTLQGLMMALAALLLPLAAWLAVGGRRAGSPRAGMHWCFPACASSGSPGGFCCRRQQWPRISSSS
ncbi:sodium:solute symporter family transporter [Haliea atlantica]